MEQESLQEFQSYDTEVNGSCDLASQYRAQSIRSIFQRVPQLDEKSDLASQYRAQSLRSILQRVPSSTHHSNVLRCRGELILPIGDATRAHLKDARHEVLQPSFNIAAPDASRSPPCGGVARTLPDEVDNTCRAPARDSTVLCSQESSTANSPRVGCRSLSGQQVGSIEDENIYNMAPAISPIPATVLKSGKVVIVPLCNADWKVVFQVATWEAEAFGVRSASDRECQYRKAFKALEQGRRDESAWGILASFVALDDQGSPLGSVSLVSDDMAWMKGWQAEHGVKPWLASLYVKYQARGQGVGTKLVEHVARETTQRGFSELYLYCCPDNKKLNHWYERRGFSTWGGKLQGGFRVMHRSLGEA